MDDPPFLKRLHGQDCKVFYSLAQGIWVILGHLRRQFVALSTYKARTPRTVIWSLPVRSGNDTVGIGRVWLCTVHVTTSSTKYSPDCAYSFQFLHTFSCTCRKIYPEIWICKIRDWTYHTSNCLCQCIWGWLSREIPWRVGSSIDHKKSPKSLWEFASCCGSPDFRLCLLQRHSQSSLWTFLAKGAWDFLLRLYVQILIGLQLNNVYLKSSHPAFAGNPYYTTYRIRSYAGLCPLL